MTKLSLAVLAVLLTLASVAAAGAQPTIRAVAATGNPSGAILMNSWQGYHALAVAAVNDGSQTVQAEVHVTVNGPGGVLLCETKPVTGECLTSLAPDHLPSITFSPGVVKTFSVFLTVNNVWGCSPTSDVFSTVLAVRFGTYGEVYVPVVVYPSGEHHLRAARGG